MGCVFPTQTKYFGWETLYAVFLNERTFFFKDNIEETDETEGVNVDGAQLLKP